MANNKSIVSLELLSEVLEKLTIYISVSHQMNTDMKKELKTAAYNLSVVIRAWASHLLEVFANRQGGKTFPEQLKPALVHQILDNIHTCSQALEHLKNDVPFSEDHLNALQQVEQNFTDYIHNIDREIVLLVTDKNFLSKISCFADIMESH